MKTIYKLTINIDNEDIQEYCFQESWLAINRFYSIITEDEYLSKYYKDKYLENISTEMENDFDYAISYYEWLTNILWDCEDEYSKVEEIEVLTEEDI